MSAEPSFSIADCPAADRASLEWILDESFEGLYLRHAKKTLGEIQTVRVASGAGGPLGLAMIKILDSQTGYVFYVAVAKAQRRKGIAGALLDDAIEKLGSCGAKEVFASVEEENGPSLALFESRGFVRTRFSEVSKKRGTLGTIAMYREMMAVPGETLLQKGTSGAKVA